MYFTTMSQTHYQPNICTYVHRYMYIEASRSHMCTPLLCAPRHIAP